MSDKTFEWRGLLLPLWDHPYNKTITNERAVEVPIALDFVRHVGGAGLEVGNVLAHYGLDVDGGKQGPGGQTPQQPDRRVVDRYEDWPGVENLDVFAIEGHYDWIVSVSTLEHVRETTDDPALNEWAPIAAMLYLRGLLKTGGRMLVTIPLGVRPVLDDYLLNDVYAYGTTQNPRLAEVLVRTGTTWLLGDASPVPAYGPHGANAVWIGEWSA